MAALESLRRLFRSLFFFAREGMSLLTQSIKALKLSLREIR